MSELYLIERAESCRRLAREERDLELRDTLQFLADDYRAKAEIAMGRQRHHAYPCGA